MNLRRMTCAATVATALCIGAADAPFAATIWGDSVYGTLTFGSDPLNYFDPANGFVPSGYGNSAGLPVTVGAGVEFGYDDGSLLKTSDFTGDSLALHNLVRTTVSDLGPDSYNIHSFFDIFTELSVDGGATWIPSDSPPVTIPIGGGSVTVAPNGDELTMEWDGTFTPGEYDLQIEFGVPEPSTWAMILVGFAVFGYAGARGRTSVPAA